MGSSVGGMLLLAVIALALAYLAYRNRPAEATGHSMAFGFLKPLVKITAMVLAGLTLGWIFIGSFRKIKLYCRDWYFYGRTALPIVLSVSYWNSGLSAVFHNLWRLGLGIVISGLIFSVFCLLI